MPAEQPGEIARLDVNAEIAVHLNDLDRQANFVLVDMSCRGARFRGGVLLPPQAGLTFKWMGPSRDPILVHGHVSAFKMVDARTAEYGIQFSMPEMTRDRFVCELLEMQRRRGIVQAQEMAPEPIAEPLGDDELGDRQAYRAVVQFPAIVKAKKKGRWVPLKGEVRDLSASGILLLLPTDLATGTELELAFSLPFEADVRGHAQEVVEVTPFGERRVKKAMATRPFELIQARARIVKNLGSARTGGKLFGVRFVELTESLEDEIARWIHIHQLGQLRKVTPAKRRSSSVSVLPSKPALASRPRPSHPAFSPSIAQRTPAKHRILAVSRDELAVRLSPPKPVPVASRGNDVFGLHVPKNRSNQTASAASNGARPDSSETDVFGLGIRTSA